VCHVDFYVACFFQALLLKLGLSKFNQFLWVLVIWPRKSISGRGMTKYLATHLNRNFICPDRIHIFCFIKRVLCFIYIIKFLAEDFRLFLAYYSETQSCSQEPGFQSIQLLFCCITSHQWKSNIHGWQVIWSEKRRTQEVCSKQRTGHIKGTPIYQHLHSTEMKQVITFWVTTGQH